MRPRLGFQQYLDLGDDLRAARAAGLVGGCGRVFGPLGPAVGALGGLIGGFAIDAIRRSRAKSRLEDFYKDNNIVRDEKAYKLLVADMYDKPQKGSGSGTDSPGPG